MKKLIKLVLFVALIAQNFSSFSQAPEGINYQATVRNTSGTLMTNQSATVVFEIKQGSATGTTIYRETHNVTTNNYGGFNAVIGSGTATTGTFSSIGWGANTFYLKVQVNGNDLGTTQLVSVPYALYAKTSGSSTPGPTGATGPQGATGAIGPQGPAGAAGATGPQGNQGATGAQGATGPAGTNGTNGTNGLDGKTVLNGITTPGSGTGVIGDFYINTTLSEIYGPKTTSGWGVATSLIGATGPQGATGSQGVQGIAGATGPQGPASTDDQDIDSVTLNGNLLTVHINNGASASVSLDSLTSLFENNNGTIRQKGGYDTTNFLFGSPQMDNDNIVDHANRMFFNKEKAAFRTGSTYYYDGVFGSYVNSNNWDLDSLGLYSFSSGNGTSAKGIYSVAMGNRTNASGSASVALGAGTEASNHFAMAYGASTKASGYASTASGWYSEASGYASTAIGYETKAVGALSLAMGNRTQANSPSSLVIGRYNDTLTATNLSLTDSTPLFIIGNGTDSVWPAIRSNAFVVFNNGKVTINDEYSLPILDGNTNQVIATDGSGNLSWEDNEGIWEKNGNDIRQKNGYNNTNFVFGSPQMNNDSNTDHNARMFYNKNKRSFRVGYCINNNWDTDSLGLYSFATGYSTKAIGFGSTALGSNTEATGHTATALGSSSKAIGDYSTATGFHTEAIGDYSTAFGYWTDAIGEYSTAMGFFTEATGGSSTAMGRRTEASGNYSTAMGYFTDATGSYSTAIGRNTEASGYSSTAMGYFTTANINYSTALGLYNDTTTSGTGLIFSIGNGISSNRLNAMHIYKSSNNAYFRGNVYPMVNNTSSLGSTIYRWTTVYATNGTINTSDTTLKTNIQPLSYGLAELMKVKTISYNWKGDERQVKKIGFNAQNLLQVIPEVVQTHSEQTNEDTGEVTYKENETLGVFYSDMIPVLTKSIQEQQAIIEKQEARNEKQETRIENQETENQKQAEELKKLKKEMEELKRQLQLLVESKED